MPAVPVLPETFEKQVVDVLMQHAKADDIGSCRCGWTPAGDSPMQPWYAHLWHLADCIASLAVARDGAC